GKNFQLRVRKVVFENRAEIGAFLCHAARATLAKTDTVSLTGTLQNYFPTFLMRREVVTRDGVPPERAINSETPGFSAEQQRSIIARNIAAPANRIFVATLAEHREVRIRSFRQADLRQRARMAAATSREHRGDGLPIVSNQKTARFSCGRSCGAVGVWRFA